MSAIGLALGLAVKQRARAGSTVPAFDPAQLFVGGVGGGWYDPSDIGSMFQDGAGTIPAAVDSPVGRINDKSGNGNHLTQSVPAGRPMLRQGSSRTYLSFDGIDDFLRGSFMAMAQPLTAFAAARITEVDASLGRIFDASGSGTRILLGKQGATSILAFAGSATEVVEAGVVFPTSDSIWTAVFSGASSLLRRDGTVKDSGNAGASSLSGSLTVGANASGVEQLAGRLYGLIIVGGTPLPGPTEQWLAAKAGVML